MTTTVFRAPALDRRRPGARRRRAFSPSPARPRPTRRCWPTVDGQPITEDDLADAMADIGPGLPQKLEGAAAAEIRARLPDRPQARRQEGRRPTSSTSPPTSPRSSPITATSSRWKQLLGSVAKAATTEEAERKAYDEAAKAEPPQEEIHARHILLPTEDEAKKALARVKGGEDFAKVANELSKDPAATAAISAGSPRTAWCRNSPTPPSS